MPVNEDLLFFSPEQAEALGRIAREDEKGSCGSQQIFKIVGISYLCDRAKFHLEDYQGNQHCHTSASDTPATVAKEAGLSNPLELVGHQVVIEGGALKVV